MQETNDADKPGQKRSSAWLTVWKHAPVATGGGVVRAGRDRRALREKLAFVRSFVYRSRHGIIILSGKTRSAGCARAILNPRPRPAVAPRPSPLGRRGQLIWT